MMKSVNGETVNKASFASVYAFITSSAKEIPKMGCTVVNSSYPALLSYFEENADNSMYPKMRKRVPAMAKWAMEIADGERPI